MKRAKEAFFVVALSLLLLLVLEVGVRVLAPQHVEMHWLAGRPLAVEDSALGYRTTPGSVVLQKGPEFEARYEINRHGLRDRSASAAPPSPGALRILLLGDSFAFGVGGAHGTIWPTLLEQELTALGYDVRVLNAGVPGYDTGDEVRYLERLVDRFTPDVVLLGFVSNDLFTNEPLEEGGTASSDPAVVRRGEKQPALHILVLLRRLLLRSDWIYTWVYRRSGRAALFEAPPSESVRRQREITGRLLGHAVSLCRARELPFVLLSLPQQFQVLAAAREDTLEGLDVHAVDRWLDAWAAETGVPAIAALDTLARAYRLHEADLYYRYDGHLNARGNRVVGAYVARRFADLIAAGRIRRRAATTR